MKLTKAVKEGAIRDLLTRSMRDLDFYVLLIGSIAIAEFAIFDDSIPVLIASMIVAPLATPILALGLGVAAWDGRLVRRAVGLLGSSCLIALGISVGLALVFGHSRVADHFISFSGSRLDSFIVAIVSGAIAAYALVKPKVVGAVTGVAIAVSLMPPLVATGIGLAPGGSEAGGAFVLFLLNVLGILVASVLVFSWIGLGRTYQTMKHS